MLQALIRRELKYSGSSCDLNFIDVSEIDDFSSLFLNSWFDGNISDWDVSNATTMHRMFDGCAFQGDISQWDVSNAVDMREMFCRSKFKELFHAGQFTGNISSWPIHRDAFISTMFSGEQIWKNQFAILPHWRLASISFSSLAPNLQEFYETHAPMVKSVFSDPVERTCALQDIWRRERVNSLASIEQIAIAPDLFK